MKIIFSLVLMALLCSCASINSTEYMARVEGNLWRGSRQDDLSKLSQFKKIINLEEQNEYVNAEKQYAADHGIIWHHYPISEDPFIRPDRNTLRAIVADIQEGMLTYIHCRRGKDRTGYAIAAYRILTNGWDTERAYQEAIDYGHASLYYWRWKQSLKELKTIKP